jgi:hypothetical protein
MNGVRWEARQARVSEICEEEQVGIDTRLSRNKMSKNDTKRTYRNIFCFQIFQCE